MIVNAGIRLVGLDADHLFGAFLCSLEVRLACYDKDDERQGREHQAIVGSSR